MIRDAFALLTLAAGGYAALCCDPTCANAAASTSPEATMAGGAMLVAAFLIVVWLICKAIFPAKPRDEREGLFGLRDDADDFRFAEMMREARKNLEGDKK